MQYNTLKKEFETSILVEVALKICLFNLCFQMVFKRIKQVI